MQFPFSSLNRIGPVIVIYLLMLCGCGLGSSKSVEEHMAAAREFIAANDVNSALLELKNALQKESNLPEARWLVGNIYLQQGNGAGAFKELSQAQSLGYTNPELEKMLLRAMLLQGKHEEILEQTYSENELELETMLIRADAFLGLQKIEEARKIFNDALSRDNESVRARNGLIQIALYERDLETAEQLIEETLSIDIEDSQIWVLKGQLAFLQESPEKAQEAFERANLSARFNATAQFGLARALLIQEKLDEAMVPVDTVAQKYPTHPLVKYYRGYVALLKDDKERAKVLLEEVLSVLPEHPESLLLLARLYHEEGQYTLAETHISKFLAQFPNHLPAVKLLSVIQLRLQKPGATVDTLADAASQAQEDWQVLALMGSALMEEGNLEKGIEYLEKAAEVNPETAAVHTQLALGHMAKGSMDAAISELESAIELDQGLIRAEILLVLAHLRTNKVDDAVIAAQDLVKKHEGNPVAHNLLGAAYQAQKNEKAARNQYNKALEIQPEFIPALGNLARMDLANRKLREAGEKFNKILSIDGSNTNALISLAYIASENGDQEKMVSILEKASSSNPSSIQPKLLLGNHYLARPLYSKALEISLEAYGLAPDNPAVMLLHGHALRLNGKPGESVEILGRLHELVPGSAEVAFQLGLAQIQSGEIEQAKLQLEKVLERDKEHFGALSTLARLAINQKNDEEIERVIGKIMSIERYAADGIVLKGDAESSKGNFKKAIGYYSEAYEIGKNTAIVIKLAQAHDNIKDRPQALKIVNDWLSENPGDSAANLFLASLHQQGAENSQAIQRYNKVLESNPDNVVALNNLAWAHLESDPERALDYARRANKLAPESPEVMDTLGWVLFTQENVEEGLAYLGPARERGPQIPSIRFHYAAALKAAGELGRAQTELQELLSDFDEFPELKEAKALLAEIE